jgi:2-dehydro-3-deoxyphosphogalactonate aldolase
MNLVAGSSMNLSAGPSLNRAAGRSMNWASGLVMTSVANSAGRGNFCALHAIWRIHLTLSSELERRSPPIVAILRGVQPNEVLEIGAALIRGGIRIIEVPLNSPEPLRSIELLAARFGEETLIGAGTVLTVADVDAVAAAGGRLIVSPNVKNAVIERAIQKGLDPLPGFMTPSEAFAAIDAGARHIKLFPGNSVGPAHARALRDVLPKTVQVWAVGGADAKNLGQWMTAGTAGIGVGGSLYKPGTSAETIATRARELVTAWRAVIAS